jgi:hypothetical protein
VLRLSRIAADELIWLAHALAAKLPVTFAALRDGLIDLPKARTIAEMCGPLSPAEARGAEALLFGDPGVGEMTRGMIRDRIARAAIGVNPKAAARRREHAARTRRVEVLREGSGNAMIAGRELPPAAVLAASQNLNLRARELRAAGVPGGMDELRVLAYLEKLGALDPLEGTGSPGRGAGGTGASRPPAPDGGPDGRRSPDRPGARRQPGCPARPGRPRRPGRPGRTGQPRPARPWRRSARDGAEGVLGPGEHDRPAGHPAAAGRAAGDAVRAGRHRPGPGPGPGRRGRRNPRSTWCLTVTGPDGRPAAHGCGRPPPRPTQRDPAPPATTARDGPVYIPGDDHGPPGGYGTVRLDPAALARGNGHGPGGEPAPGRRRELMFALEALAGPCDHRHQAAGHDPGVTLKHLTGILNATCTFPPCRRPESQSDYEHSLPYQKGGRTCLCQAGPVCRANHQDKQSPGWHLHDAGARGWFRWTTPSGRSYLSRPTQYPD